MSDDAERSQRVKMKRCKGLASKIGIDVLRNGASFAQRELRGRRARFPSLGVGDCGAVTEGPDTRKVRNGQHRINDDGAALVMLHWNSLKQRVGSCTGCPHECLCANLFVGLQDYRTGCCIGQAGIELESNTSRPHTIQCISRQWLTQFRKNSVA